MSSKRQSGLKGFVYRTTDARIHERLEYEDTFTDVFAYGEVGDRQLALISFDEGTIDAIATMVRGQAVASYKRVVRFAGVTTIDPALSFDELLDAIPEDAPVRLGGTLQHGGPIAPARFAAVLDGLVRARPDLEGVIADLSATLRQSARIGDPATEVLGFERDAVGVALDAAGLNRLRPEVLRRWRPTAAPAPFLEGIRDRRFNEDQMIAHDMRIFGDWSVIDDGDPLTVSFTDGRRQVTIANVNRTDVETSTGADLIYYSHDWDAYVLVQYKRMEHEQGKGWSLRPSRAGRLPEELERLKALPRAENGNLTAGAFRLSDEAAYLKLCRQLNLGSGEARLADGIYLPVSFYELLINSPETLGPKGGRLLTLDGLRERWLTNSSFTEMVARGFIGSRDADSRAITEQIRRALDARRSVTLAVGGDARYRRDKPSRVSAQT